MSVLFNSMLLSDSKAGFSSYTDFLAYITGLSTGSIDFTTNPNSLADGEILVSVGSDTGTMWGSSWGQDYTYDSVYSRILRHACPTQAVFNAIVSNSRKTLIRRSTQANAATSSLSRNGYTSSSFTSTSVRRCTRMLYWDDAQGTAYTINPYGMGSPSILIP